MARSPPAEDMMRGNGACDPGALDRIERGMNKIGPGGGFTSSPASFRGTLRQMVIPLEGLSKSSSGVLAGDPGASAEFRRWLDLTPRGGKDAPDGKPSGLEPSEGGAPFRTGRDFVRIFVAVAVIATDERDLDEMRGAIGGLIDTARWVEALDIAALRLEQTGDPGLLEHLIYLFERYHDGLGREDVMPPPPGDLVTDPGECMRFLNDALDGSRRQNARAWGTITADTGWTRAEPGAARPRTEDIASVKMVTTRRTHPYTDRHGVRHPGRTIKLKTPHILIEGHDFGARQPSNVSVLLPCEGSCRDGAVRSWSNERITLYVPLWLGTGPVGFRYTSSQQAQTIDVVSGTMRAIREVAAMCEASFGGPVEPVHPITTRDGGCPRRLDDSRNVIAREKAPSIEAFTGPDGEIDSFGRATLSWVVWGAESLNITSEGPGPAFAGMPARPSGSRMLQFVVLAPRGAAETSYTLSATNQWGTTDQTVTVTSRMSNRNIKLMNLQDRILARFGGASVNAVTDYHLHVANRDYVASHYNVDTGRSICFAFMGIGYGDPHVLAEDDPNEALDLDNPELLLFDDQNMLVGFAYVRCRRDNTPADFAHEDLPVEPSEWYYHPAGWHTKDGGFSPDPALEGLENPCKAPGPFDVIPPAGALYPHGPVWGVHIFFNLAADRVTPLGPPLVGITTRAMDLPSPPNIPHWLAPRVVDVNVCAGGGLVTSGWFQHVP